MGRPRHGTKKARLKPKPKPSPTSIVLVPGMPNYSVVPTPPSWSIGSARASTLNWVGTTVASGPGAQRAFSRAPGPTGWPTLMPKPNPKSFAPPLLRCDYDALYCSLLPLWWPTWLQHSSSPQICRQRSSLAPSDPWICMLRALPGVAKP